MYLNNCEVKANSAAAAVNDCKIYALLSSGFTYRSRPCKTHIYYWFKVDRGSTLQILDSSKRDHHTRRNHICVCVSTFLYVKTWTYGYTYMQMPHPTTTSIKLGAIVWFFYSLIKPWPWFTLFLWALEHILLAVDKGQFPKTAWFFCQMNANYKNS